MSGRLCAACAAERDRWLATKPSTLVPQHARAIACGAAYDDTPAGVRDNTRARYEAWRQLVNEARQDIKERCLAAGHSIPIQGDLLAELQALEAS